MDKEHEIIGKVMEEQVDLVEKELEKVKGYYIAEGREFTKFILEDFMIVGHRHGGTGGNS